YHPPAEPVYRQSPHRSGRRMLSGHSAFAAGGSGLFAPLYRALHTTAFPLVSPVVCPAAWQATTAVPVHRATADAAVPAQYTGRGAYPGTVHFWGAAPACPAALPPRSA